jgi:prepilin-type processing-associated H-X9-DG protein
VVIAIIAVLAAILFPVFSRARHAARRTTCAANLRQVGLSVRMYADDCDDLGPCASGWHRWGGDGTAGDAPGPGWEEQLDPYARNRALYRCPDAPRLIEFAYFINTRSFWTNYGCTCVVFTDLEDASKFVLMAECSEPRFFPPPLGSSPNSWDTCDKDNMTYPCLAYVGTFHGTGSNVLFADGHTRFCLAFDPQRMTLHPTEMSDWR